MIPVKIKLILTGGKLPDLEENMNRVESTEIQLDLVWVEILAAGITSSKSDISDRKGFGKRTDQDKDSTK